MPGAVTSPMVTEFPSSFDTALKIRVTVAIAITTAAPAATHLGFIFKRSKPFTGWKKANSL